MLSFVSSWNITSAARWAEVVLRTAELLGPESGKAPVNTLNTKFNMGQFAVSPEIKS